MASIEKLQTALMVAGNPPPSLLHGARVLSPPLAAAEISISVTVNDDDE